MTIKVGEETYYSEEYVKKLNMQKDLMEQNIENLQIVLDKIKEYAGELRLFDNESVEFEISNKILELLEEIE